MIAMVGGNTRLRIIVIVIVIPMVTTVESTWSRRPL